MTVSSLAKRHDLRPRVQTPGHANGDRIRVLLVEDHLALRRGLELLLRESVIDLAGVASTGDEACRLYETRAPDVAIVDITLGTASGLSVIRRVLASDPEAGIVVFAGSDDRQAIEAAASCGARGFVFKAGGSDELVAAIRAVASGGVYVDPAVSEFLAGPGPSNVLTVRERQILQLLARGHNGERIAEMLFISSETVRTHVRNAMGRLGASTRVHAVVLALDLGEISHADAVAG